MKIAALTSGGVDSSVALALLKGAGHDVTAFYLKIWLEDELRHLGDCAWEEDIEYVEQTCKQLDVPFIVLSLQREYWKKVVDETVSEVQAGRTPNPDIWCNERIKFGSFFDKIPSDFVKVSTGHYARVEEHNGQFFLYQAPDPVKDQTYFLSRLTQQQLSRAMFPIGHLPKIEVRELARRFDLPSRSRPDSQGICFLGKFEFADFLRQHLGESVGPIVEADTKKTLGEHRGFWFYTVGQRQGLGLSGGPWYVTAKDTERNIVFVAKEIPPDAGRSKIIITDCNWIPDLPPEGEYDIKLRHGPSFTRGIITHQSERESTIILEKPDRGIAEGQSAVLYSAGRCWGGGVVNYQ